jgi:hypothetical protein
MYTIYAASGEVIGYIVEDSSGAAPVLQPFTHHNSLFSMPQVYWACLPATPRTHTGHSPCASWILRYSFSLSLSCVFLNVRTGQHHHEGFPRLFLLQIVTDRSGCSHPAALFCSRLLAGLPGFILCMLLPPHFLFPVTRHDGSILGEIEQQFTLLRRKCGTSLCFCMELIEL